jgi:hypothetical protein
MKKDLAHCFITCGHMIENGGIAAEVEMHGDRVRATNAKGNLLFDVSTHLYSMLEGRKFVTDPIDPWAQ